MGIFDWIRGRQNNDMNQGKIPRFAPVSENDEMLLPHQIKFLKANANSVNTEIWSLMDESDEMLPECSIFIPNLLAEFQEDPSLAMIHGLGTAHAWIDIGKLRAVLAKDDKFTDYQGLFRAFNAQNFNVKKIQYIRFRSAIKL
jgi:hypothetical protein